MRYRNTFETVYPVPGHRGVDRIRIEHLPDLVERVFNDEVRRSIPSSEMHERNHEQIDDILDGLRRRNSFYNGHDRERIESMIRDPRRDLTEAVDQYRDRIVELMPPDDAPRRRIRRGQEYGDSVDIDREICGVLECWDRSERMRTAQRQVTIAVNLSFSGRTTERDLLPRGGLAAAMVTQLQKRGVAVELVAVNCSYGVTYKNRLELVEIVVKAAGDTIDEATLATMCCDVGFVRAVMYGGSFTLNPDAIATGWGSAVKVSEITSVLNDVHYDFVIDGNIWTPEQGVAAINALIEKAKA